MTSFKFPQKKFSRHEHFISFIILVSFLLKEDPTYLWEVASTKTHKFRQQPTPLESNNRFEQ